MKRTNKTLSVILAAVMVIGIFPFGNSQFCRMIQPIANAADAFTLYGSAKYLEDGSIQLTPIETYRTGSCYYNDIIDAREGFAMSVNYLAGGGSGADGIAFCFSETKGVGGAGEFLGFVAGNNSYGVELDSFYNGNQHDPCQKHIAILGNNINNHMAWAQDKRVDDNAWHSLKVIYNATDHTMSVFLDGLQTLNADGINLPDYCYLGITAATGGSTNLHLISNLSIISKYVNISSSDCGIVNFTVVNANTLEPIKGANIFVSNDTDGDTTFVTNTNGNASVLLPIGKQTVSVYCGSYQTRNINIDVKSGVNNIPTIGLSEYGIVDAKISVSEMSYEEIISAGIDVSAPENNHVFKYDVTLTYIPTIDVSSIAFYFNSEGKCVGGECSGNIGQAGFGTFPAYEAGEGYAIKFPDETVVYAASEKMLLVIRGEAKWLKEMFDVEMIIMNNSLTDTVENCTAKLALPDGLSLAKMSEGEQSLTQTIDHIDEGACASVHWYLCGDKEGDYMIGAELKGKTMPFEEAFTSYYEAGSAIHVYAGSAFALTFEVPDVVYYNDNSVIRISLENVSDRTIYNVTHSIENLKQCRVTYESNGVVDEETYKDVSNIGYLTVPEMKSGDKIVIELSVNIMFDSKALREMLENWCETIDDIEKFCNLFDVVQRLSDTVYDLFSKTLTTITSAKSSLDELSKIETLDEAKHNAVKELSSSLTRLMSVFSSNDSDRIVAANKLVNSKAYAELVKFTDESNEDMFTPINDWVAAKDFVEIMNVVGYLNTILKEISNNGQENKTDGFDAFDSIRTAIRAIPIYYVLSREESYATTLSGSTTEIPITITTYDNGKPQYFGVSDMAKYIYSLGIAAVGRVKVPGIFGILGGYDANDITDYDGAVKYIKATEAEIARIQAVSATGDVSFRAYVVKNEESNQPIAQARKKSAADTSLDNNFVLSCDNDSAIYEKGVLSFSGGGIIEITPLSTTGGTLYIEDSNGNVFTYVISVLPQHECDTDESVTILTPTDYSNGYIAKCCSVCGDVLAVEEIKACDEHLFNTWVVEQEASCSEIGIESRECTVCGYNDIKTIDMLAHTYGDKTITREPTCIENGENTYRCSVCNAIKTEEIPATGHTEAIDEAVAATCTTDGKTEGSHCSVCGEVLTAQEAIPATGHSYGLWTKLDDAQHKRVCANDNSHVETENHDWDNGAVTAEATCTQEGEMTYTCTVCGAKKTETIPAKGHSYSPWTKLDDSHHQRVCDNDKTHVETGEHLWDGGVVKKEATPEEEGEKLFTCTVCGAVRTEPIGRLLPEEITDDFFDITVSFPPGAFGPGVALKVQLVTDPGPLPDETYTSVTVYDISAVIGGTSVQPDSSVTVRIPLPEGYNAAAVEVYHITADGAKEKMAIRIENGYIVFTADSFNRYAVVDTSTKVTFTPGDVDGDGELTSGDARLALRASVQLEKYEPGSARFLAADADGSGTIESGDARLILRASVKLEDPAGWGKRQPAEKPAK